MCLGGSEGVDREANVQDSGNWTAFGASIAMSLIILATGNRPCSSEVWNKADQIKRPVVRQNWKCMSNKVTIEVSSITQTDIKLQFGVLPDTF